MSQILSKASQGTSSFAASKSRLKSLIGVAQLNSSENLERNYEDIKKITEECVDRGAKLICLPDRFAYQPGKSGQEWSENPETGRWFKRYRQLAMENCVWMSLGGFPEQHPTLQNRYYSTHYIINDEGFVHAKYRKMHMFSANLENIGGEKVQQNKQMLAGSGITQPCFSPVGYLGLSVSYDLRFPELYRKLTLAGAQILMIPSSFTAKTGGAHFETLMRTRAIENQCYVVTAN